MRDKHDFWMKINITVFYKLTVSFLLVIAKHAQSTEIASLQYLEKERRDEVDFLLADKPQTFQQVDTINLGGHGHACPNNTKIIQNDKFEKSFRYSKILHFEPKLGEN